SFVVAHDHDRPFGERCCIVSAGATVEGADISGFIFQECRVEVAEAVDFQRTQKPIINNAAMQAHTHNVPITGPASCAIKISGMPTGVSLGTALIAPISKRNVSPGA